MSANTNAPATAATAPPDNTNCLDKCSLNIGSCLFGVAVKIHYTFFILWILEVVIAQLRYSNFTYTVLLLILYGPVLFVTILIHEFGHCLMNRYFGGQVHYILIWPLGGFAIIGPTSGNVMQDFWVALAGPLTHLPQIGFWVLVYAIFSGFQFSNFDFTISIHGIRSFVSILAAQAIELNVFVFVFNLFVPAYPLDGGRCLAALLVQFGTDVTKAAKITAITAMVIACAMIAYAIYNIAFQGEGPGLFIVIIALLILTSSAKLLHLANANKARDHPFFNRPCYLQQTTTTTSSSAGVTSTTATKSSVGVTTTTTANNNDGNIELGKTDNHQVEEKPWYQDV